MAASVTARTSVLGARPARPASRSPRPARAWSRRRTRSAACRAGPARPAPRRRRRPPRCATSTSLVRSVPGGWCSVSLAGHRRDQQLQPGDRVVGDAADRVDVRADVGQRPRDRPESPRGDRAPEHQDDVRGVPARGAGSSAISSEVCTCMPMLAIACSTASCRPSGSRCAATSAPSVSCPRMTTCSTSSRSTPCRVSAANSTELTPGRSGPVTVIRTVGGTRARASGTCGSPLGLSLALLGPARPTSNSVRPCRRRAPRGGTAPRGAGSAGRRRGVRSGCGAAR